MRSTLIAVSVNGGEISGQWGGAKAGQGWQ
jgi:hypothetical protein